MQVVERAIEPLAKGHAIKLVQERRGARSQIPFVCGFFRLCAQIVEVLHGEVEFVRGAEPERRRIRCPDPRGRVAGPPRWIALFSVYSWAKPTFVDVSIKVCGVDASDFRLPTEKVSGPPQSPGHSLANAPWASCSR